MNTRKRLQVTAGLAAAAIVLALGSAAPALSSSSDSAPRASAQVQESNPTVIFKDALPASSTPIPDARAAGITKSGGGYMGWSVPRTTVQTTEAPDVGTLATVAGMDVASYQGNVNWTYWWNQGKRFAYVKATEGTGYRNPYFAQQYNGSYNVGMIRGAYHFARPNVSGAATQANYFVDHGGGWSRDGKTLPGALDIEYNPYPGGTCYGLSASSMVSWIRGFANQYKARTGRDAVIYSTTDWWRTCTGNNSGFGSTNPLWIARYASSPGTLPAGWGFWTFWQYTSSPLDQNYFNGAYDRLRVLACNGTC